MAREKKYDKSALTDNVKFNEMLSPLYLCLLTFFIDSQYKLTMYQDFFRSTLFFAFCSTLMYVFATNYFQPDLDVKSNRPGMGHFPMGRWFGKWKFGRFLKWFIYPLNRAWYWMWHPYGQLLTHRGAGHWPVLSVWLRVWYLMFWIWVVKSIASLDILQIVFIGVGSIALYLFAQRKRLVFKNIKFMDLLKSLKMVFIILIPFISIIMAKIMNFSVNISIFEIWLRSFFPWDKNFGNFYFILFCFPIYLSDTVHIAVDYYDSKKRSMSFCPPRIPRGLIIKTINTLRGVR